MEFFLTACLSYFVIVDPVGVTLIFGALTGQKDPAWQRRIAIRASLISVTLVLFFGFFGAILYEKLGIAIESFRIAGGLLLFYTAFVMVTGPDEVQSQEGTQTETDISVFPLSIPMMAGPGCLTLTVLLFSDARQGGYGVTPLVLAVVSIYLLTFCCLLASGRVTGLVGKTGNSILKRLLGVLLAALSIQFIADGIRGFLP